MPIYEYACPCGARFEELVVRKSDEADVSCRVCGSRNVERLLSRPAAAPAASRSGAPARGCGPVG
jgi:putative FmdB family regulatory protein